MDFLNFVPVEYRGMSILTMLTFAFIAIGAGFWWSTVKRELKRINKELAKHEIELDLKENAITVMKGDLYRIDRELDRHDTKLEERIKDISEMKIDIALTLQSVRNIEKMLERNG
jgi:chromosome segregation ATPase